MRWPWLLLLGTLTTTASAWEQRGYLGLQGRGFWQSPLDDRQRDASLALIAEPEWYREWDDGAQSLTFRPLLRWDSADDERTAADVRELMWIRAADGWELRAGVGKVFWGTTEALHLVDIINQTDLVANPDGEQKLGQPMVRLSREGDYGTLDLYLLPYFRERTFPGVHGRLRTQPRVADELADYEAGNDQRHLDLAVRWSRYLGDWDLGVAAFHGTSRDPDLRPTTLGGEPVLAPYYPLITQFSVDLAGTMGDWLWKLEALHRDGQGGGYWAATGGFEYTWVGFAGGAADLGLLGEVMLDDRGDDATTPFNHDVFTGVRWVANDVAGSEVLAGVITDWQSGARVFNVEASRRFGQRWKLSLQMRAWASVPADDPLSGMRRDDYVETTLYRYF